MREIITFESKLRGLVRRLSAWIERKTGRPEDKPGHRQLANQLTSKVQEAIDRAAAARAEPERPWVSGDIAVLLDYNTFAELDPPALNALADELRIAAIDAIANRQYESDSVAVRVSYDPLLAEPTVAVAGGRRADRVPAESAARNNFMAVPIYTLKSLSPEFTLEFPLPLPLQRKKRSIVSIGRSGDNALSVNHSSVSKFHATIGIDPDGTIAIADMGSTNGTFVNHERVQGRTVIHPGDVVTIGEINFRLEQQ